MNDNLIELDTKTAEFEVGEPTGWLTPTSHGDPQGEWGTNTYEPWRIENSHNGTKDDGKMAVARALTPEQNLAIYGDPWSGWLELYPPEPIWCNRIREASVMSNYHGRVQIKAKYNGTWHIVYSGDPKSMCTWHVVELGGTYLVEGMGFRFERPSIYAGIKICYDFYEGEFWRV